MVFDRLSHEIRAFGGGEAVQYGGMLLLSRVLLSAGLTPRLSTNDRSTRSVPPLKQNPPHMSTPPPLHSLFEVPAPRCAAPMRKLRTSAIAVATTKEDDQMYCEAADTPMLRVVRVVYFYERKMIVIASFLDWSSGLKCARGETRWAHSREGRPERQRSTDSG